MKGCENNDINDINDINLIGDIFGGKARRPEKWSAEVCSTEAILLFFSSFQLAVQKAALMPYQEVSSSREEVESQRLFI